MIGINELTMFLGWCTIINFLVYLFSLLILYSTKFLVFLVSVCMGVFNFIGFLPWQIFYLFTHVAGTCDDNHLLFGPHATLCGMVHLAGEV